jgi:hypothetical protein
MDTGGRGMSKHRKSGHANNVLHFTGKSGSDSQRKRLSSRKQRRMNRGTHVNKYAK